MYVTCTEQVVHGSVLSTEDPRGHRSPTILGQLFTQLKTRVLSLVGPVSVQPTPGDATSNLCIVRGKLVGVGWVDVVVDHVRGRGFHVLVLEFVNGRGGEG